MRDFPAPRKRQRTSVSTQDEGSDDGGSEDQSTSQFGDNEDLFVSAELISPGPVNGSAWLERPKSAGKKTSKQLQFEEQVDRAMMHSQHELAKATCAQVNITKEQLEVEKKKASTVELQQHASSGLAEMADMCTSTQGFLD
ncbi:hypothetical protein V7S43_012392 [Phytophthora oleae]|uniref:No apical meristem-associated C-terminal domain-containing protein n=1 Tax=Phytophthora oleae TaxID=2107226 RepID=A0ABD3F6R8_9STRA